MNISSTEPGLGRILLSEALGLESLLQHPVWVRRLCYSQILETFFASPEGGIDVEKTVVQRQKQGM